MPSFFRCRVVHAAAVRLAATLAAATLLLFVSVASSGGQSANVASANADPRIARVESDIRPRFVERSRQALPVTLLERMAELGVPGLSVAVLDDGEIAWARGYGVLDLETRRPVTPETLFLAGSISKPVAAACALRLVQEGKLGLDDDVNRWLRSWRVPPSEAMGDEVVTLRRLLTHTAGLTVHGFPGYPRTADLPTIQQILDGESPANTAPVRVDILPGSEWRYSGGGYTVMQLLIGDVSGRPFGELLGETVLLPFGMRAWWRTLRMARASRC
jgi:CubicO group peptidase (beta-lactamase class C family)